MTFGKVLKEFFLFIFEKIFKIVFGVFPYITEKSPKVYFLSGLL